MSRLGKNPITIPAGVTLTREGKMIRIKGAKGELARMFRSDVKIEVEGNTITLTPTNNAKTTRAMWGTYAAHLKNMIKGVTEGFDKKLIVEGVGYRGEVTGKKLVMSLGFSHKVELEIPEGVTVTIEKSNITVAGIDKEAIGSFAANLRSYRKPEPYKGKGIRYENEVIRRKEGKKTA